MLRQWQQALLLLAESLQNQLVRLSRHAPTMGDVLDPGIELAVEISQGTEVASGEKGCASGKRA